MFEKLVFCLFLRNKLSSVLYNVAKAISIKAYSLFHRRIQRQLYSGFQLKCNFVKKGLQFFNQKSSIFGCFKTARLQNQEQNDLLNRIWVALLSIWSSNLYKLLIFEPLVLNQNVVQLVISSSTKFDFSCAKN